VALAELRELEAAHLIGTYARQPVAFVRGEGSRLWDAEGEEYLDFLSGISVTQLGHCHPRLVEVLREQAGRLWHASNLYYTEPSLRLAERLAVASLGGKAFFTNSGAEAIECAIKLARRRRPGGDVVVFHGGFHGRTYGALSATPQEAKQAPFAPLVPGFRPIAKDERAVRGAVDERTAAVIVEPIQGESGIQPVPGEVLAAAREACDEHGALLVFDEIQCGMGRTGTLWAWQQVADAPDVMCVAKALGGGLPIGACVTKPEHGDVLRPGDHGSTFAGGPLIASVALAVLETIDDAEFLAHVREMGEALTGGLCQLALDGLVRDVRGLGLMVGFDVDDAPAVARRALLEQRLVVNATGPGTIRLLPPLTCSRAEVDEALDRLASAISP
jgi:acetylornithine/N-succinyldiaminopimelate aminotransferase